MNATDLKVGDVVRKTNYLGDTVYQRDYKINWIRTEDAGATSVEEPSLSVVLNLLEDNIEVIEKAPPEPEAVQNLSDEELLNRIKALREERFASTRVVIKKEKTEDENMIDALLKLTPDQLSKLKEKLIGNP